MSGKMNYEKRKRDDKVINNSGAYSVEKEKSFNKYLEMLYHKKSFDAELFEKGMEYFNLGGILQEAKDEYKNNYSFVNGYNKAKRLAIIAEVEEKYKSK